MLNNLLKWIASYLSSLKSDLTNLTDAVSDMRIRNMLIGGAQVTTTTSMAYTGVSFTAVAGNLYIVSIHYSNSAPLELGIAQNSAGSVWRARTAAAAGSTSGVLQVIYFAVTSFTAYVFAACDSDGRTDPLYIHEIPYSGSQGAILTH